MNMAKIKGSIPATEQGMVPGDYKGSRNFDRLATKGGRNATTNEARRGAGQIAPRPQSSKQPLLSSSSATASTQGSMARVPAGGKGDSGQRLPVQKPTANQVGTKTPYGGNGTPPAQRGGPAGLRAGGRNQNWPNGPQYTDAVKKGGTAHSTPTLSRANQPTRRKKGANFYGEFGS
jgi:hypothetical protein